MFISIGRHHQRDIQLHFRLLGAGLGIVVHFSNNHAACRMLFAPKVCTFIQLDRYFRLYFLIACTVALCKDREKELQVNLAD